MCSLCLVFGERSQLQEQHDLTWSRPARLLSACEAPSVVCANCGPSTTLRGRSGSTQGIPITMKSPRDGVIYSGKTEYHGGRVGGVGDIPIPMKKATSTGNSWEPMRSFESHKTYEYRKKPLPADYGKKIIQTFVDHQIH